jgi:ABC-type branched-subunit amino acid transport system substrate-binding protein
MAVNEINAAGGILGEKVRVKRYDTKSNPGTARENALLAIERDGAKMIFGGASSAVAVAVGKVAQDNGVSFFATLTYSTAPTGTEARRHVFRECYNAWMAAKAIASYLKAISAGRNTFTSPLITPRAGPPKPRCAGSAKPRTL